MKRPFASIGFTYLIALLAAIFAGVNASVVLGDFVPAAFSPAVLQKKHTEKAFGACINGGNRVFRLFWGVSDKCLSGFRPGRF